jgi:hypothetical protein
MHGYEAVDTPHTGQWFVQATAMRPLQFHLITVARVLYAQPVECDRHVGAEWSVNSSTSSQSPLHSAVTHPILQLICYASRAAQATAQPLCRESPVRTEEQFTEAEKPR